MEARPLLGAVFGFGDSVQVEGMVSTYGGSIDTEPEVSSCDLVKQIVRFGGLPFLKANVSQGGSPFLDASVWGQSNNPWNKKRIAGTSTEAALIA